MALRFPRGHAATKKMIASCAAQGVGIDGIEGAPSFRFIPAESKAPPSSFSNGDEYGEPSKRGSIACGKPKPKHIKNWNPSRLSVEPQYNVSMAGDDHRLTQARRDYAMGKPAKLRAYLAAQAAVRASARRMVADEPVQLALAA
jgi:hypothetical protein